MAGVSGLGYIGWDVKNVKAWDDFLHSVYGLELRADSPRNARHYRLDDRHHRLSLYAAKKDGVRFIGWEAETREDLNEIVARLKDYGIKVKRGTKAQIKERAVMDLICFEDPDGFKSEVYFTGVLDSTPFRPARGMSGFNTGSMGLGHIVVHCKDRLVSIDFYQRVLGFTLSDYIYWPDNTGITAEGTFLHCNARHHTLAIMNPCFGVAGGEFNHLMLEANSLDDVGRAYDIVQERGFPVGLTMGRHTNDRTTSFYMRTPSGWMMEYGYGGVLVDDETWEPKMYDAPRLWGHNPGPDVKRWPRVAPT